jgi:hypothetical protein
MNLEVSYFLLQKKEMSRKILIENLSDEQREKISGDLKVEVEASKYAFSSNPTYIFPLCVEDDYVYVPFAYGCGKYERPSRESFPPCSPKFEGELRPGQAQLASESLRILNRVGSVIIAAYTGFGKSCTAVWLITRTRLKALVVCHRVVLINQWESSFKKFCPSSRVQILESSTKELDPSADFYIMNALNVPKKSRSFFSSVGVVVVDEAHLIMAEGLSQCMLSLVPRYVIGLSATPYRFDGLNVLLDLYFGVERVERKLWHPHTVWKVETDFVPSVEVGRNGKVNWNVVINSQASDVGRNELIVRLVKFFPSRVFLILCKRVDQSKYLFRRLREEGESVTSLIGSEQFFDESCRVLVGTSSKAGVGFDHPRLDSLILAGDIEQYFIQYLGRIFRRVDVAPMIFDIVDKNPILLKHYRTRESVYVEHGGSVKSFRKNFPDFFV